MTERRRKPYAELDPSEKEDVKNILQSISIFKVGTATKKGFMTPEQLEKIAGVTTVEEAHFKDILQIDREKVQAAYLVLEGTLAKFHRSKGGDTPEVVEYITRGGQIGQLHMICDDIASSTCLVDSETAKLVRIALSDVDEVVNANPDIIRSVANNLALTLRGFVRRSQSNRLVRLVEHLDAEAPEVFEKSNEVSTTVQFISAAASGIGSMTCGYPLDVARTRLQSEGRGDIMYGLEIMAKIYTEEGLMALFRGWSTNAVSHTVQNSTYHSLYGKLVKVFKGEGEQVSDAVRLLLGVVAGCFAAFLVTPLSIITFRMQGKEGAGHGFFSMIAHIIKTDGFMSLWHGLGPSLVLAINPCITFYVFDELKTWFLRRKISRMKGAEAAEVNVTDSYQKLTPLETLCLGAMAKAVASTITFPLLMAKIRMGLFGKERYPTMMSTFSTVLQEEGFAGMFKGMGLSLMRSVFIAALEFAMRDKVQESIQKALTQKAVKGSR
eukprot:TRINITY_DN20055_c1_g2_i2.p1 TRINITY_DN20055_c1_g2~~TRINITY_DN20055_c1_g2_i2.p1  ORF type:complete len:495 (+),score=126.20 TRINITY_DN20055_c1_g2_i2:76-1560(+)